MSEVKKSYLNEDDVKNVVNGFEDCTTPPSEFDHRAHVTVAFAYLHLFRLSLPEATDRMRQGLYRYLDHHGPDRQKYNETITLFWIKLVGSLLDRCDTSKPSADLANEIVTACGGSQKPFEYFSKERLASDEAKIGWIEPDFKPLDF